MCASGAPCVISFGLKAETRNSRLPPILTRERLCRNKHQCPCICARITTARVSLSLPPVLRLRTSPRTNMPLQYQIVYHISHPDAPWVLPMCGACGEKTGHRFNAVGSSGTVEVLSSGGNLYLCTVRSIFFVDTVGARNDCSRRTRVVLQRKGRIQYRQACVRLSSWACGFLRVSGSLYLRGRNAQPRRYTPCAVIRCVMVGSVDCTSSETS